MTSEQLETDKNDRLIKLKEEVESLRAELERMTIADPPIIGTWTSSFFRRVGNTIELMHEGKRERLRVVEWMSARELCKLAEDLLT